MDKSRLIQDILGEQLTKVLLLPRPRRFGKTLNMRMLEAFLAKVRRIFPTSSSIAGCTSAPSRLFSTKSPEDLSHFFEHRRLHLSTVSFVLRQESGGSFPLLRGAAYLVGGRTLSGTLSAISHHLFDLQERKTELRGALVEHDPQQSPPSDRLLTQCEAWQGWTELLQIDEQWHE